MRWKIESEVAWRVSVHEDLERRGVGAEFARRAVERLDALPEQMPPREYAALLAGLEAAHELHCEGQDSLRRTHRNLLEIERLLPVFSGEFKKLEEALKILNAFLQRMTRRTPGEARRIVH